MPTPLPVGPQLIQVTRVVEAGKTSRIDIPGVFFRAKEANYGFQIGLDETPPVDWDLGIQYTCPAGEHFRSLTVNNPLAVSLEIVLLIGRGNIDDDRLNVIERRNGSAPSTIPPTFTDLGNVAGVSGGWAKLADANPNRAQLLVNRSQPFLLAAGPAANGGPVCLAAVGGLHSLVIDTKAEVWGKDLGASAADFNVAELTF